MSARSAPARRALLPLALAIALAGCQGKQICTTAGTIAAGPPPPDWHDAVTDADHIKLRATRDALTAGVQAARTAGFGAALDGAGRLFDPDYAQDGATLPPGSYACRSFTLGSKVVGRPAYVAGPARLCTVATAGQLQRFRQVDGPQRPTGRIYPDTLARTIFLGTMLLADEATALHYSRDADRDLAGAIQRIGAARWRMVIPHPAWEATVDVIELTPAG